MKVLVACEFSGIVRDAFAAKGHDAWSCDLLPSERPGQHYQGYLEDFIGSGDEWDLIIGHPPCTFLTVTGNKWFKPEYAHRFPTRKQDREYAISFFMMIANRACQRIAIENPVGVMSTIWRKSDQIIQPYWFGHPEPKKTCLWLKGLPLLRPTNIVPQEPYHVTKSGRNLPKWYAYADKSKGQQERSKIRSRTFPGIAQAMADQWG